MNNVQLGINDVQQRSQQVETFINRIFETSEGYITIWTKGSGGGITVNKFFDAQTERTEAIDYVLARLDSEVWCSIATSTDGDRGNEHTQDRRWIIGDADNKEAYGHLDFLKITPTITVQTSEGKFHLYYDMGEVQDNDAMYERNKAFVDTHTLPFLKGMKQLDAQAKDPMRLLRIPGTLHKKNPANPQVVQILEDNGSIHTLETFEEVYPSLSKKYSRPENGSGGDSAIEGFLDVEEVMATEVSDEQPMCSKTLRMMNVQLKKLVDERHGTGYNGTKALLHLSAEGHCGVPAAIRILHESFLEELEANPREDSPHPEHELEDIKKHIRENIRIAMQHETGEGCKKSRCSMVSHDVMPQLNLDQQNRLNGKPRINLSASAFLEDVKSLMGKGVLKDLFVYNGDVVIVRPHTTEDDNVDHYQVMSNESFSALMDQRMEFYTLETKGDELIQKAALFPQGMAHKFLTLEALEDSPIKTIKGFATYPFITRNGNLVSENGYDVETGLVMMRVPGGIKLPETVTEDQAKASASWVQDKLLGDMLLKTDDDRAHAIGYLVAPLFRDVLPRHTFNVPLFAITANTRGSGKSYLTNTGTALYGGSVVGNFPKSEEELGKQIVTKYLNDAGTVLGWDNAKGEINSGSLESLLTQTRLQERILGGNTQTNVINDKILVINGNKNAFKMGGDMDRRTLWIDFHSDRPDPENRPVDSFQIPNYEMFIKSDEGRVQILTHLLTMVKYWVQQGKPLESRGSDSFAPFNGSMRGLLKLVGVRGEFASKANKDRGRGSESVQMEEFLSHLYDVQGDKRFTIGELVKMLTDVHAPFPGAKDFVSASEDIPLAHKLPNKLSDVLETGGNRVARDLSTAIGDGYLDTWFGDFRIVEVPRSAGSKKAKQFYVDRAVPSVTTVVDSDNSVKPELDTDGNIKESEHNWNIAREGKTLRWLPVTGSWTNLNDDSEFIPMTREGNTFTVLDMELYGDIKDDEEFAPTMK